MILSCVLCNNQMDSKKEKVIVTVKWIMEELLKLNDIKHTGFQRVVNICNDCWENKLKKKPDKEDYFWTFSKKM